MERWGKEGSEGLGFRFEAEGEWVVAPTSRHWCRECVERGRDGGMNAVGEVVVFIVFLLLLLLVSGMREERAGRIEAWRIEERGYAY